MREFNDRHLLTIQSTAKSRLKRSGLFVSAQLKPMVEIAEILFTKGFDAVPKCKPRPKPEEPKKRARFDLEDFDDVELDEEDYSDED